MKNLEIKRKKVVLFVVDIRIIATLAFQHRHPHGDMFPARMNLEEKRRLTC